MDRSCWVRAAALVGAVALLAGCGGGSDDGRAGDPEVEGRTEEGAETATAERATAWILTKEAALPAPRMSAAAEPHQVWSRDTGEMLDAHVVLDDRLLYVTRTGPGEFDLVAVALDDGEELWRNALDGSVAPSTLQDPPTEGDAGEQTSLVESGGFVLLTTSGSDYRAVDPATGDVVWERELPGAYGSSTGRGPDACITYSESSPSGESGTACMRALDGTLAWTAPGYVVGESDRTAYLRTDAAIVAVDLATGEERWQVLGAGGSVAQVGDVAVICDRTISGVDEDGLRRWDVVGSGSTMCWPTSDGMLLRDEDGLRLLRVTDGNVVAEGSLGDEQFYPGAELDGAYVSLGGIEGGSVRDLRSGSTSRLAPGVDHQIVADGVIATVSASDLGGPGPGGWSVAGGPPDEHAWSVDVGWTRPVVEPTDTGLLVISLRQGGMLWFGTPGADGPSLSAAVEELGGPQTPPEDVELGGDSVLGVPFGTPLADARSALEQLLGPPSAWNEHTDPEAYSPLRVMWGTLEVRTSSEGTSDDAPVIGWRDWGQGWSSGFPISGGVRAWTPDDQLAAAGYTASGGNLMCREDVCFEAYYDSDGPRSMNIVQAPGDGR